MEVLGKNNRCLSDLKLERWRCELVNDVDEHFLLNGIEHGFKLVDRTEVTEPVDMKNHPSCFTKSNKKKVEKLIRSEIDAGRYVPIGRKPLICSPLAAIAKDDGSVRLIHDASRPHNVALNDYADIHTEVHYEHVKDALKLIEPGSYCCKIDLKSAYRSVGIDPSQYHMTGIQWQFSGDNKATYMVDTRLMMGATKAPAIFHRLTQAVKRCMDKRGFKLVVYLDDFLVVAPNYDTCLKGQHVLIALLRDLGFAISWPKVVGPTQKLVFLGIEINTNEMTVALPSQKVNALQELLFGFRTKKRASCKQLQSLAGKLNWACQVIKCGRSYVRSIFDAIKPLCMPYHKARLSDTLKEDIQWWIMALKTSPGKAVFYNPEVHVVQFDASNGGSGFVYNNDWGYVDWRCDAPQLQGVHINCKETISAVFAARRWASLWRDSKVVFCTDNKTAKSCIVKGTAKNPQLLPWVRELHMYSVLYNFEIDACWIPGVNNVLPDAISRLRYPNLRTWFMGLVGASDLDVFFFHRLAQHMSNKSLLSIFYQVPSRC